MDFITVSEVSKSFDVSARMLRYYEKMGLISSSRREDYAYRVYDDNAVRRLQLIIVLRKLRVPLKDIAVILDDDGQECTLDILRRNIGELDRELSAINSIRRILGIFTERLDDNIRRNVRLDLLEDRDLIRIANTLSLSERNLKEEQPMEELKKATEASATDFNVRLIMLPPFTVAAFHYIGENPEENVGKTADEFIRQSRLYEKKPDSRMFGFNHPNPSENSENYGYEVWLTIPEDMELPENCVRKHFDGGLYAAHTIDFPNFQEWGQLAEWAHVNGVYRENYSELGEEIMGGCLEEHINWVYSSNAGWPENGIDGKIDLLMPIKKI